MAQWPKVVWAHVASVLRWLKQCERTAPGGQGWLRPWCGGAWQAFILEDSGDKRAILSQSRPPYGDGDPGAGGLCPKGLRDISMVLVAPLNRGEADLEEGGPSCGAIWGCGSCQGLLWAWGSGG